jgi:DNA-binding response OmpR family regulator
VQAGAYLLVAETTSRVLVVEDDPLIALDLKAQLCGLGFSDVHLANNLTAGSTLVRSKTFGLGILDVNIGRRLVFPLAAELRVRRIPIVFCTGYLLSAFPPEWATHPIVQKPLTRKVLVAALSALGFRS